MMLSRAFAKPMQSQLIKSLAARQLSTNPLRADMVFDTPLLRTDVPSTASYTAPVTASAPYDIKESPLHYQVAVNIPKGIEAGDLTIEIEHGAKALRVSGNSARGNFSKRFAWGGTMDVDRLTTDMKNGVLYIQAPKIHFLNGNSPFASA